MGGKLAGKAGRARSNRLRGAARARTLDWLRARYLEGKPYFETARLLDERSAEILQILNNFRLPIVTESLQSAHKEAFQAVCKLSGDRSAIRGDQTDNVWLAWAAAISKRRDGKYTYDDYSAYWDASATGRIFRDSQTKLAYRLSAKLIGESRGAKRGPMQVRAREERRIRDLLRGLVANTKARSARIFWASYFGSLSDTDARAVELMAARYYQRVDTRNAQWSEQFDEEYPSARETIAWTLDGQRELTDDVANRLAAERELGEMCRRNDRLGLDEPSLEQARFRLKEIAELRSHDCSSQRRDAIVQDALERARREIVRVEKYAYIALDGNTALELVGAPDTSETKQAMRATAKKIWYGDAGKLKGAAGKLTELPWVSYP